MKISQAAVFEPKNLERRRIVAALKKAGVKVSSAEGPDHLRKEHLVVLGPSLKGGAKWVREIRKHAPSALVLAGMKRVEKAAWADGVLPLPVSVPDLEVRLPELVKLRVLKEGMAAAPKKARAKPASALAAVEDAPSLRPGEGILDPLTGFYTFPHFKEVLFVEVKRARRYNLPLALALIGFDRLDISGEDTELREKLFAGLALAIRRSLRDTDFAVQYSPDRVVLLMPHTDLQGALVVSRRICDRVARATLQHGEVTLRPTISAGVSAATTPGREFSFAELVRHAQNALDRAGAAGGNRVEFSVPDPGDAPTEQVVVGSGTV